MKKKIITIFLLQQYDGVHQTNFLKSFPSYDQFIIQYQLLILNIWPGHCV
jgi:hypothetical protein